MTELALHLIAVTASTITLGWTPPPGAVGYYLYADNKRVSNSTNGQQAQAKFKKVASGKYKVEALGVTAVGEYPAVESPPPPPPPPPPSGTVYGQENFADGAISLPWQPSQFFPTGTKPPQVVADPLGQQGNTLLLQADYAPTLPTDYTNSALQQTAISVNPQYAHAGMNEQSQPVYSGMETWYRFSLMAPAGNVFCSGESNWLTVWHDTTGGTGPKSSGLLAFGGYPLNPAGTLTTKLIHRETVDVGGGNYQDLYFPGAVTDPLDSPAPPFVLGHWYDIVYRKIWSPDPTVGLVEWWVDGTKLASKKMQTQAVNDWYSWGFYNYRYNTTGASRIYYDNIIWGSSAAAIGFTP